MNKKLLLLLIPTLFFSLSSCGKKPEDTGDNNGDGEEPIGSLISLAPGIWNADGAWFAAYCWNGDGTENIWYVLSADETYYSAEMDTEKYINIIFVRFSNTATEASWLVPSSIWNQTIDLTFGADLFTVTSWGDETTLNKSTGVWSNREMIQSIKIQNRQLNKK